MTASGRTYTWSPEHWRCFSGSCLNRSSLTVSLSGLWRQSVSIPQKGAGCGSINNNNEIDTDHENREPSMCPCLYLYSLVLSFWWLVLFLSLQYYLSFKTKIIQTKKKDRNLFEATKFKLSQMKIASSAICFKGVISCTPCPCLYIFRIALFADKEVLQGNLNISNIVFH